eukprot:4292876-Prymnesium_polylepis.1
MSPSPSPARDQPAPQCAPRAHVDVKQARPLCGPHGIHPATDPLRVYAEVAIAIGRQQQQRAIVGLAILAKVVWRREDGDAPPGVHDAEPLPHKLVRAHDHLDAVGAAKVGGHVGPKLRHVAAARRRMRAAAHRRVRIARIAPER